MANDFYRITEIARRLGLSRSRVYVLIAKGELPAVRVGNVLRVPVAAWDAWLQRKNKEAGQNARG